MSAERRSRTAAVLDTPIDRASPHRGQFAKEVGFQHAIRVVGWANATVKLPMRASATFNLDAVKAKVEEAIRAREWRYSRLRRSGRLRWGRPCAI